MAQMRNRIKERRKELGLTQLDLAKKASISRQYISKFERNSESEPPSLRVANEIARALGTCIYRVFDLNGNETYSCDDCDE